MCHHFRYQCASAVNFLYRQLFQPFFDYGGWYCGYRHTFFRYYFLFRDSFSITGISCPSKSIDNALWRLTANSNFISNEISFQHCCLIFFFAWNGDRSSISGEETL